MCLSLSELESSGAFNELKFSNRGIEKESLRINKVGNIALSSHNEGLGSALTNPYITTDFSESLLELITPTFHDPQLCLNFLSDIHSFVYKKINNELMWSFSMPCPINSANEIPIGNYGSSNAGTLKKIYRKGLSQRYGSMMQSISGIHYNFSFSDNFFRIIHEELGNGLEFQKLKDNLYLGLARNFRRYSWLYFLLFGSSPAVSNSFIGKKQKGFQKFLKDGAYKAGATSLRMGDLGYISSAQDKLSISMNSLEEYCSQLKEALHRPYPPYKDIGEFKNNKRVQLNTSIIQIENEYYSTIRPKRVCPTGERPLNILGANGIEYLELRCIDLNPFSPIGIERNQLDFLDLLLFFCLIKESPPIEDKENDRILANHKLIINEGRNPKLKIQKENTEISPADYAKEVLYELESFCDVADKYLYSKTTNYWRESLQLQNNKINNFEEMPSAKILNKIKEKKSYLEFGLDLSQKNKDYFETYPSSNEKMFEEASLKSLSMQKKMESYSQKPFEEYLQEYLAKIS